MILQQFFKSSGSSLILFVPKANIFVGLVCYTFRFYHIPVVSTFTFAENPCLLTFEEPKNVTENGNVTLTCSTLSSCTSGLKIEGPSASLSQSKPENPKKTTLSFKVTWEDDGRMFSCQTENNTDPCLIRNISLTVGCKFITESLLMSFLLKCGPNYYFCKRYE